MGKNRLFDDYNAFVDKFKHKKTTDDCYTLQWMYDLVLDWIDSNVYPLDGLDIMRPFWPGANYQAAEYGPKSVVIDNPPFSIFSSIVDWYVAHGVRFWLWAPAYCLGGAVKDKPGVTAVVSGAHVTYENGALEATSFVTNLYPDRRRVHVAGELTRLLAAGEKKARKGRKAPLPRYELPDGVVTSARLHKIATAGIDLVIGEHEAVFTRGLESQKAKKKKLFGGGWILSREAAAREAAAREAAARETFFWPLSPREQFIMDELSRDCQRQAGHLH